MFDEEMSYGAAKEIVGLEEERKEKESARQFSNGGETLKRAATSPIGRAGRGLCLT